MSRNINTVLFEAVIIGLMNATLIFGINKLNIKLESSILHVIVGALIHLIFEYTGGNRWWCTQTYKV